jgi:hypothetical protein
MFTAIWVARSQGWRVFGLKKVRHSGLLPPAPGRWRKNNSRRCDKSNAPRGDLF